MFELHEQCQNDKPLRRFLPCLVLMFTLSRALPSIPRGSTKTRKVFVLLESHMNVPVKLKSDGIPFRCLRKRAGSKDRGQPSLIILWALDACLIWFWTVVLEQIFFLLFWRLTTPLFGAAWAKLAPEIRPTSRRKNTNFPMVFTNQCLHDTFVAIVPLDYKPTVRFNQCFPSGERREEVEVKQESGHIKFPTFSNVIFSKVQLFIFDLIPVLDSPLPYKLNLKKSDWGKAPNPLGSHLKLVQIAIETFSRQSCTTKVIHYPRFNFFWQIELSALHLAKLRLVIAL